MDQQLVRRRNMETLTITVKVDQVGSSRPMTGFSYSLARNC
jgi:hypothetical protein